MRGFVGAAALLGRPILAATPAVVDKGSRQSPSLPPRGDFVIRNAYLMTMDAAVGDIPNGSIRVSNGQILEIGPDIAASGVQVIEGQGMIVLPGLVETHWHMWNTLLRSMATEQQKFGYFPTSAQLGAFYEPHDMFLGTRLAAAEAINSGITFVHDWCHNPRTPEHARENIRALAEIGIRSRFSYGPARGIPITQTLNLEDVAQLHRDWNGYSNEGLLTLGLAWRGIQYAITDSSGKMTFQPIPSEVYQKEYDLARSLDIPITAHCNIGPKIDVGHVLALQKRNLLYKDLQLVHMISSTPEEIDMVASSGASVSFSPLTEMRTGFGIARPADYLSKGIRVGLSVDTTTLSGDADMFDIMKVTENIVNGLAYSEFAMPARAALELGTIGGARSMGMDDHIGSLTVGKRADIIMVDTRGVNIGMFTDAANMIIGAAQPANVSLVMVDGRILKESGRLTAIDVEQVTAEAASANTAIRKRGGWW